MADIERVESRHFALHEVEIKGRLREVSEAGVSAVLASLEEVGQIASPIWVRKVKSGYQLIDGAHRIEAARRVGLASVPGIAFRCNDDQARMLEIDGNLAGAELTVLDTAIFLADRKRVYEKLHPETRRGVAGATSRWDATSKLPVASFVTATAEKFGQSETKIFRLVAAGERLDVRDRDLLRKAPRPVTFSDLQEIAKIKGPGERYHVVEALAKGDAKSAADARKAFNAAPTPPKDPVEEAFQALMARWTRAPIAVRRRFVDAIGDDLIEMQEAGDE